MISPSKILFEWLRLALPAAILSLLPLFADAAWAHDAARFRLAVFSADVTIPLNHRCMGVLPTKSKKIVDPLYAHGFVLLSDQQPIVLAAVDWCEIRNEAYDQWRDALAKAVGTTRQRVLLSSLHQHDAPVTDSGAAQLLTEVGLKNELFDEAFQAQTIARIATAAGDSLHAAVALTHIGIGQAAVQRVASNRRVVSKEGLVSFRRGSSSGASLALAQAPVGEIDPMLKTISFWQGDKPLLALHAYATHPMSHYGRGEVSADFVGLARARRQRDDFSVHQIYVSGCSGDVTAGKYNNGSPEHRVELTNRMYQAMVAAWKNTKRRRLEKIAFRNTQLELPFNPAARLTETALENELHNDKLSVEARILAAMGLNSRRRVAASRPIDMPCIDFGVAQIVLFPGESFVAYQLMAQKMRPDSFVLSIGYGECWPGYIPTAASFADHFTDKWLWVGPGAETQMRAALKRVLAPE